MTAGWVVGFSDGSGPEYVLDGTGRVMCKVRFGCDCCQDKSPLKPEEEARLRLIAAAPAFLTAALADKDSDAHFHACGVCAPGKRCVEMLGYVLRAKTLRDEALALVSA